MSLNLYLIRHAIAHTRDPNRWPDDSRRPLTPLGKHRFRLVSAELSSFAMPPHRLLSSPFTRAWETAQILRTGAGWPAPEAFPPLGAGVDAVETANALEDIFGDGAGDERIAVVGHRPNLHELTAYLLTGSPDGINVKIKKGGGLYLSLCDGFEPGTAELRWHTTPKMSLRRGKHPGRENA